MDKTSEDKISSKKSTTDIFKITGQSIDKQKQQIINNKLPLKELSQSIQDFQPFEENSDTIKDLNMSLREIQKHKQFLSIKDKIYDSSAWERINTPSLNAFDKIGLIINPSRPEYTELNAIAQQNPAIFKAISDLRAYFPDHENPHSDEALSQDHLKTTLTDKNKKALIQEQLTQRMEIVSKYHTEIIKVIGNFKGDTQEKEDINSKYKEMRKDWNDLVTPFKSQWKEYNDDQISTFFSELDNQVKVFEDLHNLLVGINPNKKQDKVLNIPP